MDDLIADFLAETNESLAKLDVEIIKLEQNPDDKELLGNIFRIIHTIKGTSGFLGLAKLGSIAHASENILGKVRDGAIKITPERISLILESIDVIKILLKSLEETGDESDKDVGDLINRLNAATTEIAAKPETTAIPETTTGTDHKVVDTLAEDNKYSPPTFTDVINNIEALITKKETAESKDVPDKAAAQPMEAKKKVVNKEPKTTQQSIRVNLDTLEEVMQSVSELVLTRNQLLQILRRNGESEFNMPLQRLNHITSELQERIMKTRMQPIRNAWAQFPRIVRDLAVELGKKIELEMIGEDTELDRQLIESIKDPLTHMVRNSADHGIEKPEERKMAGKPEVGKIVLKAYHQGGHIIIEISDDGKGLNLNKIKKKIIDNNLATVAELETMTEQQIQQFIFRAGFSTADNVTSVSGRGVGMDVVKTNIEKISGTIELNSVFGKGSTFTIKIPLTLAIMPILIVECNGTRFGIPQIAITEMVKGGGKLEYKIEHLDNRMIIRIRNSLLPLISLHNVLYPNNQKFIDENKEYFVVVCQVGSFNFGIIVDKIYDTEEIVVKPVSHLIKHIDIYSGCTLLGDGGVIMILDSAGLLRRLLENNSSVDNNLTNRDKTLNENSEDVKKQSSFLVFKAGSAAPRAVPLDLVSRLEEIDVAKIETSMNKKVIQYRKTLMRIALIDSSYSIAGQGTQQIIVFTEKNRFLGLVVENIIDIVEIRVDEITSIHTEGYLGSFIFDGKTVDIIDISYFFNQVFQDEIVHEVELIKDAKKILLVDDSPFFRKFIPPTINKLGYEVITAENAKEAMKILENQYKNIAIIITDINMPGVSGTKFSMNCKADDRYKTIPIIALSANLSMVMQNPEESCLDAYVSKTNHQELVMLIQKLLSKIGEL